MSVDRGTAEQLVSEIDFTYIRAKLLEPDAGKPWPPDLIDYCEREYRRFLLLQLLHPSGRISPTRAMDEFWHRHIMDTRDYARTCDRLFQRFLHHDPFFGMRSAAEHEDLDDAADLTSRLYEATFGEDMLDVDDDCWPQ